MKGSSQVEAAPFFVLQGPRRGTTSLSASQLAYLVAQGFHLPPEHLWGVGSGVV